MRCSWSETLGRPAAAFLASAALHLSAVLGLEALPWAVRDPAAARSDLGLAPLRASLRAEPEAPREAPRPVAERPLLALHTERAASTAAATGTGAEERGEPGAERYLSLRELDERPKVLSPVDPPYPNDAYLRNIGGRVLVRLFIDESGAVVRAVTELAEPPGYFEEAVEGAFRAARYAPGMKGGRPVKSQLLIEVRYDPPRPAAEQTAVARTE